MATVAKIDAVLELQNDQFNRSIDDSIGELDNLSISSQNVGLAVAGFLAGAAAALGSLALSLSDSGQELIGFKQTLSTAFDGAELDALTQKISEMGATPPITEAEFISGAKVLKTFERDVSANLDRIGDISVRTGEAFGTVSKAFAGIGSNSRAATQLEKIANITPQDLAQFGAVLDDTGKKLDITGDNGRKAELALERLADAKFAGAMAKAVTPVEQLAGSFTLLRREIGVGLAEQVQEFAGPLTSMIETVRDLSPEAKKAIGVTIALGAALAAAGAAVITLGIAGPTIAAGFATGVTLLSTAFAPALGVAATASGVLTASIAGLTVGMGAFILIAGSAGIALAAYTKIIEDNTAAEEALLAVELARSKNQSSVNDLLGKSSDQLAKEGKTATDLSNGILALHERIEAATKAGNTSAVKVLQNQVQELREVKAELATAEKILRDQDAVAEAARSPEALAAAKKAGEERQKERDKEAENKKKALKLELDTELDNIALSLAQRKISQEESLKLRAQALEKFGAEEKEKRRLLIETAAFKTSSQDQSKDTGIKKAEEDAKAAEDARKKIVKTELDGIELAKAGRSLSAQQELDALNKILSTFRISEEEKQTLKKRTAALQNQIDQEAVTNAAKNAQDLADAEQRGRSLKRDELSDKISDLQTDTEASGKDNTGAIQAAIQESLRLQVESIRLEAERAKAASDSAEVRAQIEQNAQAEIQGAIRDTAQTEKDAVAEQIQSIKDLRAERDKDSGPTLGGVFNIEDLNASIQGSLKATTRTGLPDPSVLSGLRASALDLQAIQPQNLTRESVARDSKTKIAGELDLRVAVTVDHRGTTVQTLPGRATLRGAGSEIEVSSRGTTTRRGQA